MRRRPLLLALLPILFAAAPATAHVEFFVNDPVGFQAALAGRILMGLEDWSSAGNAAAAAVDPPLQPGVANGPFPHGTDPTTGLTVQPNIGGANGSAPNSGGVLVFAPAGFVGVSGAAQPSNQLSAELNAHSLDLLFADVGAHVPSAVSLSPMFYRTSGGSNSGTIAVEVYGEGDELEDSTSVTNVVDVQESAFLGIVAEPGQIRRVNLWAGGNAVAGADNVRVYTVPEPAAPAAVALTTLVSLGRGRGRAPQKSA